MLSDLATSCGLQSISTCWVSNVSAGSTATNAVVLQSAIALETCCNAKSERRGSLESQNLMIDIGFEEMAALTV